MDTAGVAYCHRMRVSSLLLLSLAACTPRVEGIAAEPEDQASTAPEAGDGTDGQTEGPSEPRPIQDDDVEDVPAGEPTSRPGDQVFDLRVIHSVEVDISEAGIASLTSEPREWVVADVQVDGEAFSQVGVRVKGRLGSQRSIRGKAALKLDFLEFGQDQRLDGLEKLNLNNMVQDCAKIKELAAYGIHELTGTPAPRVAYAHVWVNGDDRGIYTLVEQQDDVFLKGRFADPTGTLYDGDYFMHADRSYTLVDFRSELVDLFEQDEGEDVARADLRAVAEALERGDALDGALADLVDIDQLARFIAATAWTGHSDSYVYYSNNYRAYFDPARDGRMVLLPWDPDWAFYAGTSLGSPYGVLAQRCFADVPCFAKVQDAVADLSVALEDGVLMGKLEAAMDLVTADVLRDPYLEHGRSEVEACQADVVAWFDRRDWDLASAGF